MESSIIIGAAKRMKSGLLLAMYRVFRNEQRLVKENLLRLGLSNIVFFSAFPYVAGVPLKTNDFHPIEHVCILPAYT